MGAADCAHEVDDSHDGKTRCHGAGKLGRMRIMRNRTRDMGAGTRNDEKQCSPPFCEDAPPFAPPIVESDERRIIKRTSCSEIIACFSLGSRVRRHSMTQISSRAGFL